MTAQTTLMEFMVGDTILTNPVTQKTLEQDICAKLSQQGLKLVYSDHSQRLHLHFAGQDGRHATVRGHAGVVTLDLHEYVEQNQQPKFSKEFVDKIEKEIKDDVQAKEYKSLPAIRRGDAIPCYFPTTDRKLIEYDFDELLLNQDSPYQNVKILHSPQFGNMLILDNDPNLAESDLLYTQAIVGWGREDYKDKTVLILGGGDGGILHELLKLHPKFITMVDIDEVVVRNAPKMLRGICHDSLDNLTGDNYEVLIADCIPYLEKYGREGRKFDFVINDLTAIPVTTEAVGEMWDFMRKILDLAMAILAPTGKYYTQGNGVNMLGALAMYEEQLGKLSEPVDFRKEKVYVPSYHEQWVFYEIWKKFEPENESPKYNGISGHS